MFLFSDPQVQESITSKQEIRAKTLSRRSHIVTSSDNGAAERQKMQAAEAFISQTWLCINFRASVSNNTFFIWEGCSALLPTIMRFEQSASFQASRNALAAV
jgi:hypothetical protein